MLKKFYTCTCTMYIVQDKLKDEIRSVTLYLVKRSKVTVISF